MLSGSVWGAGKSTLSAALTRALSQSGHTVRLLSEDELLEMDGFAQFERLLGPTDPMTHRADLALLGAARLLVEELVIAPTNTTGSPPAIVVTDALLPGFSWLFGRYDAERVWTVAEELRSILSPLAPLLIHLHADPATLVQRAVRDRGAGWPESVVTRVARWNVPHYPGRPVRTLDDVCRLWEWLDSQTIDMLSRWPLQSLVLDSFQPVEALCDRVLADPRLLPSSSGL